jgi:hypothetical protein
VWPSELLLGGGKLWWHLPERAHSVRTEDGMSAAQQDFGSVLWWLQKDHSRFGQHILTAARTERAGYATAQGDRRDQAADLCFGENM